MKPDYKNKKVTIMGLGLQGSGVAAAKFFARRQAKVTVTDIKTKDKLIESVRELKEFKDIVFVLGQHRPEDFKKADLIVKGPGVPNDSKYLDMARSAHVPIKTEAGIFFEHNVNPVIGVTGTRGKTTTTHLIYEILRLAGKRVLLGGNITGRPLLGLLEKIKKDTLLVLELSSFQLEGIAPQKKSPHISVVTNLGADHLNRYRDIDEYHDAKKSIVEYQRAEDFAVLNHDDEKVRSLVSRIKSTVWFFSASRIGGDKAVFVADDKIFIREEGVEKEVIGLNRLKLIGEHRIPNILAAICVARILKISVAASAKAIEGYAGPEHRLETVRAVAGVLYVNDTTATVPEAARLALLTFKDPVILIAGGSDKGLDYDSLAAEIVSRAKGLILLKGSGTDRLVRALNRHLPENLQGSFRLVEKMDKAVELAAAEASSGDVVLLSPGCASFGLFENEFDRGRQFKNAVQKLSS